MTDDSGAVNAQGGSSNDSSGDKKPVLESSEKTKRTSRRRGTRKPNGGSTTSSGAMTVPRQPKFEGSEEKLNGHIYDCSDMRQSDMYAKTTKEIVGYVGREYRYGADVGLSVENLTITTKALPDDPESGASLTAKRIWEKEVDEYVKQKSYLIDNIKRLYSLVWGQCTEVMRQRLEGLNDFSTMNNERDGLGLLKAIRDIVYNFQSQKYLPQALHESKRRFYFCVQGKHMSTVKYMETFQNVIDVIEHSGGTVGNEPGIVEGIAAHQGLDMATVDSDQEAALNQAARQHYLAVAFIFNSDRNRFGRLLENLENDFLLGDDNYPKTVTSAYNLLTNFKEDQRNMLRGPSNDGVSFNTIGEEEESAVEPAVVLATNGAAKNQNEFPHITCHRCDKKGHYASACAEERQTSTQMLMAGVNGGEFDSSPTGESFMFHTRGEVKHTSVTLNIKQNGPVSSSWILLDNQSTVDVFHNGNLLENIRPADGHMDIHCNAGVTSTNLVGDLPGYGEVWYHPGGIANILSLSRVKNRGHRVIYDSHDGNEFRVSRKNGTTRVFKESSRGLYFMDTNTPTKQERSWLTP